MIRFVLVLAIAALLTHATTPALASFADGQEAAERGDYAAALRKWLPLAEAGDPNAQASLAVLYALGQGVPVDIAAAIDWYERAAVQGHVAAQYNLGQLLRSDQAGAFRDPARALVWYDEAADQGHAEAHYKIGLMRVRGEVGPPDLITAYMHWTLAGRLGFPEAMQQRVSLEKLMTATQVDEALALANRWMEAWREGPDTLALLRQALARRDVEIATLRVTLAARASEATALRREIADLDASIARLTQAAKAREDTLATLSQENEAAGTSVESAANGGSEKGAGAPPAEPVVTAVGSPTAGNSDSGPATTSDGIAAYNAGDFDRAFAIWSRLAHEGDTRAQFHLGALYHEGRGVARDPAEARHWLGVAAHNGSDAARDLLATLE